MLVGVLALQGDFEAHAKKIRELEQEVRYVRSVADLQDISGLVMPGGESTAMLRLMDEGFAAEICARVSNGLGLFATCAGVILAAKGVVAPSQRSFGLIDIDVSRNAYGRQVNSFIAELVPTDEGRRQLGVGKVGLEGVFIRAPRISRVGEGVQVLLNYGGDPVLVRKGNVIAATFHPELSEGILVHKLFLNEL